MDQSFFLDISSYLGLVATVLLTINVLLGMMLSTSYKKHKYWTQLPEKFKQVNVFWVHNCTAYVGLLIVLLHPLFLLLAPATNFKFYDIIFPINAPYQKLFVALGTISTYALIFVLITSQKVIKNKMKYHTWKNIHLISYGTALLFFIHGIVMDPQLKDRSLDLFDAEKLVSESCLLLILAGVYLRFKYHLRKNIGKEKSLQL